MRAYLMGGEAQVLDRRAGPWGIMQVGRDGFADRLATATAGWQGQGEGARLPVLASGMIGSAQGWREAPYVRSPAGLDDIAAGLTTPDNDVPMSIVPGVLQDGEIPGVMRGEETQIIGALELFAEWRERARIVLPGTHSKWVDIAAGRIAGFATFMTGELYAVLRQHSILGRFVPTDAPVANGAHEAFLRGVDMMRDTATTPGFGITSLLFTARSLVLTKRLAPEQSLDYLSGLLIGEELRQALSRPGNAPIVLIGDAGLCGKYRAALERFDATATVIEDAAPAGLWRVAQAAGLIGAAAAHA